jgi:hypothetical protein
LPPSSIIIISIIIIFSDSSGSPFKTTNKVKTQNGCCFL